MNRRQAGREAAESRVNKLPQEEVTGKAPRESQIQISKRAALLLVGKNGDMLGWNRKYFFKVLGRRCRNGVNLPKRSLRCRVCVYMCICVHMCVLLCAWGVLCECMFYTGVCV